MTDAARCVACGREASEFNSVPDADGVCRLIAFEKFTVCFSCIPTCNETVLVNESMEPEEAALRCWYSGIKNAGLPFEEQAETVMARDEVLVADAVAARDAAWREAVERVRMLHSASCLRWIRNDESQPCSCDDTTKIHNAALDALLAAMEGA